ncbi:MAG: flagellar hook-associated protein FlgK [Pseudomonadota bacterium]
MTIISTGTDALIAFQRSLDTVAQNIANANTPGYSRQNVTLQARTPQFVGFGFLGRGVEVGSITRSYSEFLTQQVQTAGSSASRFSTLASFAARVDDLLADPAGGLSPALSSFYAAVQDFSSDPSSATRTAVFAEAGNLVARFDALDQRLVETTRESTQAIEQSVAEINQLATQLAQLNQQIGRGDGNAQPNDLLDQRDEVVRQLAERVDVATVTDASGNINLFIGNGLSLVVGTQQFPIDVRQSEFDPTRREVVYEGLNGTIPIENVLTGGTLGALLEFQNDVLDPSRRALGATASSFVGTFNTQNAQGFDAFGDFGQDIFSIGGPQVVASTSNSGTGSIAVTIEDLGQIRDSNYRFIDDGAGFRVVRSDTGEVLPLTGSGTNTDPFRAGGLAIVLSGSTDDGDQFSIEPTLAAIDGLGLTARNGNAFAAAGLLRGEAATSNLSDASIDDGTVIDFTNPNLLDNATITFVSPTSFQVNGGPAQVFTAGSPITINGAEFQVSGTPVAGDQFTIGRNTAAEGDNRNALLLAATQDTEVLQDGTLSIGQAYAQLVADVGSVTARAQASAEAQQVVLESAESRRLEVSGVNLDEEAADLIRFQQAYQAAAQVVSIGSELFDVLLNATRR